jgi:Secretion system C-terminal sorting domain
MTKYILFSLFFVLVSSRMLAQCNVVLSYTPASCPTCCDGCIDVSVESDCPPFELSWIPSDPGLCTACAETTYTATVVDDCGCATTSSIFTSGTTEIPSFKENFGLLIYPNPASDLITIRTHSAMMGKEMTITNAIGQVAMKILVTKEVMQLDVSGLAKGVYTLQIETMVERMTVE